MRTKVTLENALPSFICMVFTLFMSVILTYALIIFCWMWVVPLMCSFIPPLAVALEQFNKFNTGMALVIYRILIVFCATVSLPMGAAIAYRYSAKRKHVFLKHSGGKISYMEGVKFHLMHHGLTDGIFFTFASVLAAFCYAKIRSSFLAYPFLSFYVISDEFGVIRAFFIFWIMSLLSIPCGAFFAQKKWRAEYFVKG